MNNQKLIEKAKELLDDGFVESAHITLKDTGLWKTEIKKFFYEFIKDKSKKKNKFQLLDAYSILEENEKVEKISEEALKKGEIILAKHGYRKLYESINKEDLKKAIEIAITRKKYSDAYAAFEEVIREVNYLRKKQKFSKCEKETLMRIGKCALNEKDFWTASCIFYELKEEELFIQTVNKALEEGSANLTPSVQSFFFKKNDKKMIKRLAENFLRNKKHYDAMKSFEKINDIKGLKKVARGFLEEENFLFFNNLYQKYESQFNFNKEELIKKAFDHFRKRPSYLKIEHNWFRGPLDLFKILRHKKGIIELGKISLQKGELLNAAIAFEYAEYSPGIKQVLNAHIKNKNILDAVRIMKWAVTNKLISDPEEFTKKIIILGKETKKIDLWSFKQLNKPKKWKDVLKKQTQELLKIGHPRAFEIFKEVYTTEELWSIGNQLLRSGRMNDALFAFRTSGINVSHINKENTTEEIIEQIETAKRRFKSNYE